MRKLLFLSLVFLLLSGVNASELLPYPEKGSSYTQSPEQQALDRFVQRIQGQSCKSLSVIRQGLIKRINASSKAFDKRYYQDRLDAVNNVSRQKKCP